MSATLDDTLRDARVWAHPKTLRRYVLCWGPTQGWCGLVHSTAVSAANCLMRHRFTGGRGGISDRQPRNAATGNAVELVAATGEPLHISGQFQEVP